MTSTAPKPTDFLPLSVTQSRPSPFMKACTPANQNSQLTLGKDFGVLTLDFWLPRIASLRKQQVTHFHFGFVKLRFRVPDGTSQLAGEFVMLISLYFVQVKNLAASRRKLLNGTAQRNSVNHSGKTGIGFANITLERGRLIRYGLVEGKHRRRLTAPQLHEDGVHRDAVEPSRKSRIPAERIDIAKDLQKSFLSQIFRVGHILGHLQANGIHTLFMQLKQFGKSFLIAALSALNKSTFGIIWLGFGPNCKQIGSCRGNYASGHFKSPYNRHALCFTVLFGVSRTFSVETESSGPLTSVPSGRSCKWM